MTVIVSNDGHLEMIFRIPVFTTHYSYPSWSKPFKSLTHTQPAHDGRRERGEMRYGIIPITNTTIGTIKGFYFIELCSLLARLHETVIGVGNTKGV